MLILGGTGETGRQAVVAALADPNISRVLSYGRRPPPVPADAPGQDKLEHHAIDFDKLLAEKQAGQKGEESRKLGSSDCDSVLVALGTTRGNAGSAEAFERIDREYVLAAAEAARIPEKKQTVVYVSVSLTLLAEHVWHPRTYCSPLTCTLPGISRVAQTRTPSFCTRNRRA